ncbi:MAG: AraC family transcriptional regulator [Verrucomicrobiales bacterium]|nr:AraC family transcriptional regulator [Verrucomicrobiales bacterium]
MPPLADFVERFWYSSDAPLHQTVRIVPTGTMELVFNLGENELGFSDTEQPGSYRSFSGAVFSGAHARPLFVHTRKHVVGVHFKPGGAFRFLGVPASELVNTHVDVEALWGRFTQDLREQLRTAANPAKCFRILERILAARLENASEEHRVVRAALEIFRRDAGEAKTRDLAAHLGLSQRHFIKIFSNQVGVTPKQFARVQRFQRAVDLTRESSKPEWADVAAACGYFDQSHLIHEFQTLSGLSPAEFLRQRSERLLTSPPISA